MTTTNGVAARRAFHGESRSRCESAWWRWVLAIPFYVVTVVLFIPCFTLFVMALAVFALSDKLLGRPLRVTAKGRAT